LHTTDYFASQGIKLSEEMQPNDKLGKQLKSFTEWLKTMKKVHESKLPEGNEQLDASVNKLAEKSNKDEEVITEAMAEAYIIQGKPEKAKDVYLKLSLLNPSKNAYFAAKIDQIAW
jgi:DNA-binding SARP family transcriptional activator